MGILRMHFSSVTSVHWYGKQPEGFHSSSSAHLVLTMLDVLGKQSAGTEVVTKSVCKMVNYCSIFGCTSRSNGETHNITLTTKSYQKSRRAMPQVIRGKEALWLAKLNQEPWGKTMDDIQICPAYFKSFSLISRYVKCKCKWKPSTVYG